MNQKRIDSIAKLSPFDRYKYFIKKVADYEELWSITYDNGDFALSDIDDHTFISFWPSEEFIASNLDGEWLNVKVIKIPLKLLYDNLFPLIKKENYLINVFPVNGKSGFIVNLNEFERDLNDELKQYL
jgi:hypothetical protein